MKVIKKYNQYRRDLTVDLKCESCGEEQTKRAYDDRNFWDNVVPDFKCPKCKKSSKDLGTETEFVPTEYPEGFQI
jgi:Zn finger protein HypA/HybF involved in hydrogenase expression